jgi:hypothetical protein
MQFGGNGYSYTHLSGAGTTTILAGVGVTNGVPANTGILGGISVNTAGTSITVYDSATAAGQVIAVIGAVTGLFLDMPLQLKFGLTVVIVGAADVTILWA